MAFPDSEIPDYGRIVLRPRMLANRGAAELGCTQRVWKLLHPDARGGIEPVVQGLPAGELGIAVDVVAARETDRYPGLRDHVPVDRPSPDDTGRDPMVQPLT